MFIYLLSSTSRSDCPHTHTQHNTDMATPSTPRLRGFALLGCQPVSAAYTRSKGAWYKDENRPITSSDCCACCACPSFLACLSWTSSRTTCETCPCDRHNRQKHEKQHRQNKARRQNIENSTRDENPREQTKTSQCDKDELRTWMRSTLSLPICCSFRRCCKIPFAT